MSVGSSDRHWTSTIARLKEALSPETSSSSRSSLLESDSRKAAMTSARAAFNTSMMSSVGAAPRVPEAPHHTMPKDSTPTRSTFTHNGNEMSSPHMPGSNGSGADPLAESGRMATAIATAVGSAIARAVKEVEVEKSMCDELRKENKVQAERIAELESGAASSATSIPAARGENRRALLEAGGNGEYPFPPSLSQAVHDADLGRLEALYGQFLTLAFHCRQLRSENIAYREQIASSTIQYGADHSSSMYLKDTARASSLKETPPPPPKSAQSKSPSPLVNHVADTTIAPSFPLHGSRAAERGRAHPPVRRSRSSSPNGRRHPNAQRRSRSRGPAATFGTSSRFDNKKEGQRRRFRSSSPKRSRDHATSSRRKPPVPSLSARKSASGRTERRRAAATAPAHVFARLGLSRSNFEKESTRSRSPGNAVRSGGSDAMRRGGMPLPVSYAGLDVPLGDAVGFTGIDPSWYDPPAMARSEEKSSRPDGSSLPPPPQIPVLALETQNLSSKFAEAKTAPPSNASKVARQKRGSPRSPIGVPAAVKRAAPASPQMRNSPGTPKRTSPHASSPTTSSSSFAKAMRLGNSHISKNDVRRKSHMRALLARQKRFSKMAPRQEKDDDEDSLGEELPRPPRDFDSELAAINSKLLDANMSRRDSYMMMQSYVGDKFDKRDKKIKKEVRRRTTYKSRLERMEAQELESHLNEKLGK